MATYGSFHQPDKDAGWGLIFRLNALWERADRRATSGDYEGWELTLDAIFRNLLYRNQMEIIRNKEGKIVNVELSEDDQSEWMIMKFKIRKSKSLNRQAGIKKAHLLFLKSKEDYYNAIFMYDVWVRKFMQRHQLYLKELESNPSKALFGGAFKDSKGR